MSTPSAVHFISIGGSVMHSLALRLQAMGYQVRGSDDEIYEPSRSKLAAAGLLPKQMGWYPEKIHNKLAYVIVGMHAKKDNPELQRSLELGLPIYSYPTFISALCQNKQRIVVAGSHGKTTTTALVMHVLQKVGYPFDYLVGAPVPGFDSCLRLSNAPMIIIEGDEYPCSALDQTPKFLQYQHHIGLITGISWDHINFYPTFESYVQPFEAFADATPKAGTLIYNDTDNLTTLIGNKQRSGVNNIPYNLPKHNVEGDITYLLEKKECIPLLVFGKHNLNNIAAASALLKQLSVPKEACTKALSSFVGAEKRLSCLEQGKDRCVYLDYAHAPSKVAATTTALKNRYPNRKLSAILELHTFSSLDKRFTSQYKNTLQDADLALIYINPKVLHTRKGHGFTEEGLRSAFGHNNLHYFTDKEQILPTLQAHSSPTQSYLFMSSGTFGGLSLARCAKSLLQEVTLVKAL